MTAQFGTIRPSLTMDKMGIKKPKDKPISDDTFGIRKLDIYRQYYDGLWKLRKEAKRATRYFNGDQWHEVVEDKYGNAVSEYDHISSQGQIPIIQNIIKPTIRSLQGQFRTDTSKSVVVARTPDKNKESEMLSNTLQYSLASVNESKEVDSTTLEKMFNTGIGVQEISYEYVTSLQRKEVMIRDVSIHSMFFNGDIEDVRGHDIRVVGRLIDLTLDKLIMHFGTTPAREKKLREIYSGYGDIYNAIPEGLDPSSHYSKDFYVPVDQTKCRVILAWEERVVKRMEVHDWMSGKVWYTDWTQSDLKSINGFRIRKYAAMGVPAEKVPIMEGTMENVTKWFYSYYSPWGHILKEGESPFKHNSHPYVFYIHKISDGKITGMSSDLIDTQRQYNRLYILQDRILASSVKNTLVVSKDAMDGQTREDIGDDFKEVGGVVVVDPPKGMSIQQSVLEMKGSIGNLGIPEMIQMYMRNMQDISGVHPAMQGQQAASGTSGKLYQQQTQNSTMNSKDIMDSFAAGRRRRDMKLLKTIQQYYTAPVMIAIAGKSYTETAQLYDPELIKDIEFDLTIGQTSDSPVYRSIIDDRLYEMLRDRMIGLEQFLENTTMPFSSNLLESVRNAKQQLEENPNDPQAAVAGLAQGVQSAGVGGNQQVANQVYDKMRQN